MGWWCQWGPWGLCWRHRGAMLCRSQQRGLPGAGQRGCLEPEAGSRDVGGLAGGGHCPEPHYGRWGCAGGSAPAPAAPPPPPSSLTLVSAELFHILLLLSPAASGLSGSLSCSPLLYFFPSASLSVAPFPYFSTPPSLPCSQSLLY